jgi:hypothetical protein
VYELIVEATNAGGLSVEENTLEVDNVLRLDIGILSKELDEVRVVPLCRGLQRVER